MKHRPTIIASNHRQDNLFVVSQEYIMFESSEYHHRLSRLQENIAASGLDAMVICADHNVTYLIGVHYQSGDRKVLLVVPSRGEPSLIVPSMEQGKLNAAVTVDNILVYWEKDAKAGRGWEDKLEETLRGAKCIGIDPHAYMEVTIALSGLEYQVCELVEDLRVIKSPAEIALTRRVANYWTRAMNAMLGIARVGRPIGELMAVGGSIADEIFANEPEANWLNTQIVQFFQCSPESSSPHHLTYRPDDILPHAATIINVIGAVCGYNAENERTILTGDFNSEFSELFDITHQAHQLALTLIKPGVPCADVDCAIQDFFSSQGLAEHMRHRVGHGFGLVYHERPYTSEGSEEVFRPSMLISVEPGLYVEGVGGFRHSDTVLVTETGIENFTSGTPIDRSSLTF